MAAGTTKHVNITSWDGLDPCATSYKIRLEQLPGCYLCAVDNWDISSLQVNIASYSGPYTLVNKLSVARLTDATPTVQVLAATPPVGTVGGLNDSVVVDCSHNRVSTSASYSREYDGTCDNGASGLNLNCSAFKFDNGLCGIPSTWTCSPGSYGTADGCDCNCGAWDPDCNVSSSNNVNVHVFGCDPQNVCENLITSPGVYSPKCHPVLG